MRNKIEHLARACAAVTLVVAIGGCGGGGGDSPASAPKAEGAYEGNQAAGQFQALVLEDDQVWILYGALSGGTFFVSGFLQGQGLSSNGTFAATNTRDFGLTPPLAGSLTASYVARTSLSGTYSAAGSSATLAGTAIPASRFNYDAAANLSAISGAWSMTDLDGVPAAITISPSGVLSGASSGCAFTGSLAPRPSGKNVFNVNVTFGGAPCLLPNQSANGIAVTYLVNGGPARQLVVAGVDAARNNGAALIGTR